jgi:ATP-binding cassette subfamily F protein uup
MTDKNLNELARLQEQLDNLGLWQLDSRINEVLEQLGLDANAGWPRFPAAGCVKRRWAARWSAGRACCCWMNRPTTSISKLSTGWKVS